MSTTLDKFMEKRLKAEREEGEKKGEKKERARTVGLLLNLYPAEALLHDPQFTLFGYTQADIDAALALQK